MPPAGTILGTTTSAIDLLPSKTFYPNIFINDHLKAEVDKKMLKHKLHTENEAFIQKYGEIQRSSRCPCGSGIKYKRCHGT